MPSRNDKFFSEVIRYSQTNQGRALRQFLLKAGPLGRMIADMVDVARGRNTARQVEDAIDVLKNQGYDVTPAMQGPLVAPPRTNQVPTVSRPTGRRNTEEWPDESPIFAPVRTVSTDLDQGDINWHQTPESSNVYAFGYDYQNKILYVQYKADGPPSGKRRGVNSCNGEKYSYYSRPHAPGTVYSYGSRAQPVPEALYYAMKSASSKGKFVWQNLRVCGTHWDHQYPYQVATVPMPRNGSKPYVPRKAIGPQHITVTDAVTGEAYQTQTADRFRVRTVPVAGTRRRAAFPSTIQRTT